MKKHILRGIRPTRIELIRLHKRELIAQKGHDLLEEKLDAMIVDMLKRAQELRTLKMKIGEEMSIAMNALLDAEMIHGIQGVEDVALSVPGIVDIPMTMKHVVGVTVPHVEIPDSLHLSSERGYSLFGTQAIIDDAAAFFETALREILILAEKETAIIHLAHEIRITRRRVKALETILIPQLQATQTYIEMRLEELAREDLFRRKRIKMLTQKAEKHERQMA
jgi:V/A-type H+-transporting ATPase subunit D